MTLKFQIYKCEICGNIVQVFQAGDGNLVCCGKEMELQNVQYDTNELGEKHTPKVVHKDGRKSVNLIEHPMNQDHYIQFIETYTDDKSEAHIKFFTPEDVPEMDISFFGDNINSVEYCNIHKLWGGNKMLTNESGNYSI